MQCITDKAIIFDFDYTLAVVPSSDEERLKIINSYIKNYSNEDLMKKMWNINSDYELINKLLTDETEIDEAYNRILELNRKLVNYTYVLPSVCNMLSKLFEQYSLFVYSGRDNKSLEFALKKTEILKYFTEVRGSNANEFAKPNPQVLNSLLKNYSLSKKNVIYIGDKQVDKDLSQNLNCEFIQAKWYRWFDVKDEVGCKTTEEAINAISVKFTKKINQPETFKMI